MAPAARAQSAEPPACDFDAGRKVFLSEREPEKKRAGLDSIRCAAEAGSAPAQTYLGVLFGAGMAVPKDEQQAAQWFDKAARQNFPPAVSRLALAYLTGAGVAQDRERGRALLVQAANLGDGVAMANLGAMHAAGQVVAQDYGLCFFYATLALSRGFTAAESVVKQCEAHVPEAERMRLTAQVADWKPKAPS